MKGLLVFVCLAASMFGAEEARIRESAGKSLRLLESVQKSWTQQCFSCHHQSFPVMAIAAARKAALPVNEAVVAQANGNAFGFLGEIDMTIEDATRIDPTYGTALPLVAGSVAGVEPSLNTAIYAERLARAQLPDGHWATFDARPPSSYSIVGATAIAARAIALHRHKSKVAENGGQVGRAVRWLAAADAKSTEDAAWQLLGLTWLGAPEADRKKSAQGLMGRQNADGGWGQLPGDPSDAYATARAIQALGRTRGGKAWAKGADWLMASQLADGSWHVKTRILTPARVSPPYFESGFPHGKDQYISCAATAWALMAMAESLPQTGNGPGPVPSALPRGQEPWMETAHFGTTAELTRLLDGGLNVNASSAAGDTLLMFAAHDAEKVRLLLARGAEAKVRSKAGFDALMVASLAGGSAPALRLLLEAGAEVNPKARVRFRANALSLAAVTGDVEVMETLLAAGADPNAVMAYVGIVMMRPFAMASQFGHTAAVKMMAKRGYQVDLPDDQEMTALTWAGLMHRPGSARLLLELGADAGHKDKYGLTPAGQAASIPYAPGEVIEVLKKAGR